MFLRSLVRHPPDGVASPEPNPLWNWSILLLRFGELLLRSEGFVGLRPAISDSL